MRERQRRRARILVVDDEPQNVRYVCDVLQWAGYENVQGLTDPREALDRFGAERPDLVILDLLMPGMDGFETMESMREQLGDDEYLPFLILTSDISSESRRRALSSGARDFLTKPMSPTEVRLRVDNLLETRLLYLELERMERGRGPSAKAEPVSGNGSTGCEAEFLERWSASLDARSSRADGRSKRVAWLAGRIAEGLGRPHEEVDRIRQAALLHALGESAGAHHGHGEPGGVQPDPQAGARLLEGVDHPVLETARRMLFGLEERWDGAGHPSG
ncbi:MAG: response regulator, partial [Gemmatimonadota bacterium]|nr:response regulator [Gemmatimonadota bacterium]